jgi:hypothetical protein
MSAGMLSDPGIEIGPICWLTGEVVTVFEAACTFGVTYRDVPLEEWRSTAAGIYASPVTVDHLSHLWALFRAIGSHHELCQVTTAIEQITGHPPQTLR